ncbi:hypothetical protein [Sphingomonas morindae]|uniref:Uncharacterized protein n=1 Tax=Sphingomonas morindae TaxID=1541170 RepID=A0ABY4X683_9SPHN|nr:hypothetical protein [Sphingomonas morindae]USI72386.1 hypothetical protein LHA26_13950 [Sphingomonas morindae]
MPGIKKLTVAAAMLALAAPALAVDKPDPKGEAELAKLLQGRVAGKPVRCINASDTGNSQIIDHTAIVYRVGRTLYVNRPRGGANFLDWNNILVTKIWGSGLCSIDPVQLVDRTTRMQSGFLTLGDFVPYTKPDAPKAH